MGNDFVEFGDARGVAGGGVGGVDGAGLFVPRFDPAHFDPALLQQLIEQQQLQIAALQQQAQQQQALAQWPPPPPLSPHQDLPLSPAHSAVMRSGLLRKITSLSTYSTGLENRASADLIKRGLLKRRSPPPCGLIDRCTCGTSNSACRKSKTVSDAARRSALAR